MRPIKSASTIMLVREQEGELEVLLLKRNKALAFAGGLWVFPGGKIEAFEEEQGEDDLAAAKLAAVRETKEEANIDIDPENLFFFRHWTTTVKEPRRYATYFFFGAVENAASEVKVDDSEIKQHLWIHPQKALDKVRTRELAMMPPTIMSLQLIRKCQSVAEAQELILQEKPIFILPVLQPKNGKMFCMYEGDAGYSTGEADTVGARHRLVLDMSKGEFVFEYSDCDEVRAVNGGMHL
ncbi:MAG: NUDIX domain-containing protein [Chitinophagales bacterium]